MACGIIDVMRCHRLSILGICASSIPKGIMLVKEGNMSVYTAFDSVLSADLASEAAIRYL